MAAAAHAHSTTISQFSVLAMKQRSCASWCSRAISAASGAAPAKAISGLQRDPGDADLARPDPAHLGLGLVAIGGDVVPGILREREEPEHVAGRGRGGQRLFGIDPGGIGHRLGHDAGRGGADDDRAAVEAHLVAAAIAAAGELAVGLPDDLGLVAAHLIPRRSPPNRRSGRAVRRPPPPRRRAAPARRRPGR